jgi:hypothetical protein
MSKWIWLPGLAILSGVLFYYVLGDSLPPRTPHKVARIISGLPVPRDAEITSYSDRWDTFGRGVVEVELLLTENQAVRLISQAERRGYQSTDEPGAHLGFVVSQAQAFAPGVYRIEGDPEGSHRLSILSRHTHRLLVRSVVN